MNDFLSEVIAITEQDFVKKSTFIKILKGISTILFMGSIIYGLGLGFETIISTSLLKTRYSHFFSFGMLLYLIFIAGFMHGSNLILDYNNQIRLLLVAPISKFSILVGKTLSLVIAMFRSYFLLAILFLFISKKVTIIKIIFLSVYIFILSLISVGSGLFLASISNDKEISKRIVGSTQFILLFLSGIWFPVSSLPNYLQMIFNLNPLVYILDLFRYLTIGTHDFSLVLDISVSLTTLFLSVILGVYQFDKNLRN